MKYFSSLAVQPGDCPSTHLTWQRVATLPLYEEPRNKFKEKCASCCKAAAQQPSGWEMTEAAKAATAALKGTKKRVTIVSQSTCLHGCPTQSEPRSDGTFWHKCTRTHSEMEGDARWQIQPRETTAKATQAVTSHQTNSTCELSLLTHFGGILVLDCLLFRASITKPYSQLLTDLSNSNKSNKELYC